MKEIAKAWTDAAASTEQHVSGQKPEVRDLVLFDRALDRLFAALRLNATDLSGR
jgi:predicted ATPase